MESWFYIFKAGTSGLLSLLPVTFYGMICAGVAALVLGPQETHSQSPGENTPPMPLIVWSLRGLITLLVLLAVVLPPTSSRRIALPTAPAAVQRPVQVAAPRPKFEFTPAKDIEHASAMQWRLLKEREISGVDASILALSPDDHFAACMVQEQRTIQVIDLRSEAVWRISIPGRVEYISFHPKEERLLVVWQQDGERVYGVADIRPGNVIALPKPRRGISPAGIPFWWKDSKVLIFQDRAKLVLNLDTLEIDDAELDEEWKSLNPLIQEKLARETVPALRDKIYWQWEVRRIIRGSELPEIALQSSWPLTSEQCLAIRHPVLDCMMAFPSLPVKEDERLISTKDGSIVLRAINNVLHLCYFDVAQTPDLVWKISMPHAPDELCRGSPSKNPSKAM